MPPTVYDIRAACDFRDMVHEAAQALTEGKLVVFPTETVYGLAARALDADAVRRLVEAKGREEGNPLPLAIRGESEIHDFAPHIGPLGVRLARRCWPGPVTLVVDASSGNSLLTQLPEEVIQLIAPKGQVGLRVPDHDLLLNTLQMIVGPLVLTSANQSGKPDAHTAQEAIRALGDSVDLVFDDGPVKIGKPSTVIQVNDDQVEVLRESAIPVETIRRLTVKMFLFVCTGNTCRSPMAEALCEKMLAERLGCDLDRLEDCGYLVMSAGLAAGVGGAASEHSSEVMSSNGLSLADHQTQPVNETMIRYADRVYTMTHAHRRMILSQWPEAEDRVVTLSSDGIDIQDPVGGTLDRYQECAEQIESELRQRIDEMLS